MTPPPTMVALKGIYGGLATSKEHCPKKKCASLKRDTLMRRFVLLSSDLVDYLAKQPIPTYASESSLTPTNDSSSSPDVAVANALQSYPYPIHEVELKGLVEKVSKQDSVGEYLDFFDRYKDRLVDYQDPQEVALVRANHPNLMMMTTMTTTNASISSISSSSSTSEFPPRLLLGIFSMDSQLELERREMIRSTYLRAFVDSDTPHRICALAELDTLERQEDCQVAYVFVVSGNPGGSKELVEVTEATGPIALEGDSLPTSIRLADHDKGDIVYLNIQENGKEGKSQTYFKFAITVLERYYFDYLVKADSDTIIYPKSLLNTQIKSLPKFPNNMRIYGGDYRIKPSVSTLNLGPAYMAGPLYLLSPDLARYITSPACNRTALSLFSEDQSIGNFVHSLPKPIRRVWIRTNHFDHPVKKVSRMRTLWNKRNGKKTKSRG